MTEGPEVEFAEAESSVSEPVPEAQVSEGRVFPEAPEVESPAAFEWHGPGFPPAAVADA